MAKLPKGFETLVNPYPYQKEAIVFGIVHKNTGLLLDLGLGKTFCAINIARYRIQQKQINKILVICPTTILINWAEEIKKYSEYKATILHGIRDERIQLINKFANNNTHFGIINYEALWPFYKEIEKIPFDMLIFDESSRYVKNATANRTKALIWLSNIADYRVMLTATPIGNKPMDLWSQFMILDHGKTLGSNFWAFRSKYFDKQDYGLYKKYEIKKQSIKVFRDKISKTCITKTKLECLPDLPDIIYHTITVEMGKELEDMYNEVRTKIIAEIDTLKGTVELNVNNILTKLLRLQQITGGFTKSDSGAEMELTFTPKADATVEEVESIIDAGESCIIWCRFLHSISMLENRLIKKGIKCATMCGKTKDKYAVWKGFQQNDIPVFIGQVASGGIGIELFKQDSSPDKIQHMISYENTWGMDVKLQAEGRIHRIGQKSVCRYIDMVVKNSIDERILNAFKENKNIADQILKKGVEKVI